MDGIALLQAVMGGCLGGALAAWAYHAVSLRNSFATEREQMRAILARARIDLEEAASEVEKWSGRGARERARVEQSERRAKPNGGNPPSLAFADARSYHKHLNKGGARDRDFEASLGWK